MDLVRLASYPKSGSTWLRAALTNHVQDAAEPASIDALIGRPLAGDRAAFDETLGRESSDITTDAVLRYRPLPYVPPASLLQGGR